MLLFTEGVGDGMSVYSLGQGDLLVFHAYSP